MAGNGTEPKQPSMGALIAKAAFGILFIVSGVFPPEGNTYGIAYTATGIVVGVALIAWGAVSYLNQKKTWEAAQLSARQADLDRVKVCRVCGAKSTGTHCEYCGAALE